MDDWIVIRIGMLRWKRIATNTLITRTESAPTA